LQTLNVNTVCISASGVPLVRSRVNAACSLTSTPLGRPRSLRPHASPVRLAKITGKVGRAKGSPRVRRPREIALITFVGSCCPRASNILLDGGYCGDPEGEPVELGHLDLLSNAVLRGHYRINLVDGARGTGKTTLARALVDAVGPRFAEVQFTRADNAYQFEPSKTIDPVLYVIDDAEYLSTRMFIRVFAASVSLSNVRFVLLGRGLASFAASFKTNLVFSFGYLYLDKQYTFDDVQDSADFAWRGITDAYGKPIDGRDLTGSPLITDLTVINDELLRHLSREPESMRTLSPRRFEELVAELLQRKGYNIILTPESKDGGFDIYAARSDALGGEFLYLVECKRYVPPHHVGIHVIRALNGVRDLHRATGAAVVTTSYFTKPAREYQAQFEHQLQLHDYVTLQRWLTSVLSKGG